MTMHFSWLVEAAGPTYLDGMLNGNASWTTDARNAIPFSTKHDAENLIDWWRDKNPNSHLWLGVKAIEHGFEVSECLSKSREEDKSPRDYEEDAAHKEEEHGK